MFNKIIIILITVQFSVLSVFMPFANLSHKNILETDILSNTSKMKTKANNVASADTGINEQDFINTMFLKAEFFENWSDTNYFINPTLKTSKPLKYSENWWIDYMKDSFKTDLINSKPSAKFLQLFKIWSDKMKTILNNLSPNDRIQKKVRNAINLLINPADKNNELVFLYRMMFSFIWLLKMNYDWLHNKWTDQQFRNQFNIISEKLKKLDTYKKSNLLTEPTANELFSFWMFKFPEVDSKKMKDYLPFLIKISRENQNFLFENLEILFEELERVEAGGTLNYQKLIEQGIKEELSQKVLFNFEIVDDSDKKQKVSSYKFALTINSAKIVKHGRLSLINSQASDFIDKQLNFELTFSQNKDERYFFNAKTFSNENSVNIVYDNLDGEFELNHFLKQFFSSAIIPVFQNRSNFIESNYLDNIEYDTILINFFGLKELNFKEILIGDYLKKEKWTNILKNIFIISKNFYKDYLRTLFDLRNETYVRGFNQRYGLLANNGFKIYPRYFYFSDQYKQLDFILYSAYKNRFYQTKYGFNFNFDYSLKNSFSIQGNEKYAFDKNNELKTMYPIKIIDTVDSRKIGYNVFELQAKKQDHMYIYYDFNFGIYNWQEITTDGLNPDQQWWQVKYESCSWYNVTCHIKNGAIWIVNNLPGIKQANKLGSGIGTIFKTIYAFFGQIFEIWKFSPMLYNTLINLFLLMFFLKLINII